MNREAVAAVPRPRRPLRVPVDQQRRGSCIGKETAWSKPPFRLFSKSAVSRCCRGLRLCPALAGAVVTLPPSMGPCRDLAAQKRVGLLTCYLRLMGVVDRRVRIGRPNRSYSKAEHRSWSHTEWVSDVYWRFDSYTDGCSPDRHA